MNYIYLNLYEATNSSSDKNGFYNADVLDYLKEFDILLLTEEALP